MPLHPDDDRFTIATLRRSLKRAVDDNDGRSAAAYAGALMVLRDVLEDLRTEILTDTYHSTDMEAFVWTEDLDAAFKKRLDDL